VNLRHCEANNATSAVEAQFRIFNTAPIVIKIKIGLMTYFNPCTVHLSLFCTMTIPGQHDGSINIQTVYTATTQSDFMRTVATN